MLTKEFGQQINKMTPQTYQQKRHSQQGFTLIELMIVVAIIAILAMLAMPMYNNFTARSQAAEGFTATAGLQTEIGLYAVEQGNLPTTAELSGKAAGIATHASELQGKYFNQKSVSVADGGVITVKFDNGNNAGKSMTLTPKRNDDTGQITGWTCASPATNGIGSGRLPSSCQ